MTTRRIPKSANGEGESGQISLVFDLGDPMEAEAYEMARQLAKPHGRRKQVIVALLYGLSQYQKTTGMPVNTDTHTITVLAARMMNIEAIPAGAAPRPKTLEQPTVVISSAQKASAQDVATNFFCSMGGLFD